ncbi:hypothetical protein C1Y63_08030 [Corynebacterium sp. 13CS0277]|uniref:hypothetical protein n=1 Tax=Corynebacterium sp. 13CS0277 TaxID=2071994 RepID=UPI000D044CB9|nr:hypothetical protein [Corynebacterium sp. 13CS0277]PRQ11067.1 hypothetical protein C1Y63_08030 [Corynebacterium sp. 13CS0277]
MNDTPRSPRATLPREAPTGTTQTFATVAAAAMPFVLAGAAFVTLSNTQQHNPDIDGLGLYLPFGITLAMSLVLIGYQVSRHPSRRYVAVCAAFIAVMLVLLLGGTVGRLLMMAATLVVCWWFWRRLPQQDVWMQRP